MNVIATLWLSMTGEWTKVNCVKIVTRLIGYFWASLRMTLLSVL